MIRTGKRPSSSEEHRSTKRRKPENSDQLVYSKRVIPWKEQSTLPPPFNEQKDVWPASRILEERGQGRRKRYLVEWEAHPVTGEIFEPSWEPAEHVGRELQSEWRTFNLSQEELTVYDKPSQSSSSQTLLRSNEPQLYANHHRACNRRIIPDSSGETEGPVISNSQPSQTPTPTQSPSWDTESLALEISETQQHRPSNSILVDVPPVPDDRSEWESLRGSQVNTHQALDYISSPLVNGVHQTGSFSTHNTPTGELRNATTPDLLNELYHKSPTPFGSDLNRGLHLQRVLAYEPTNSNNNSFPGGLSQYSTAPVRQEGSPQPDYRLQNSTFSDTHSTPLRSKPTDINSSGHRSHNFSDNHSNCSPQSPRVQKAGSSSPGEFLTQLPIPSAARHQANQSTSSLLSGRCARKTSYPASQEGALDFSTSSNSQLKHQHFNQPGMATRGGTRQSPRLSTVTPNSNAPPRIAVRTGSFRGKSGNPPEHSSPLATMTELAESGHSQMQELLPDVSYSNNLAHEVNTSEIATLPPTSIPPSAMHIDPTSMSTIAPMSQETTDYDDINSLRTPVHESIEEEVTSSAEEASLASKATSSQESLRNERLVSQVDGLVMPTYPILGADEYAIALPAEGKVQAIYSQTIKVKQRAILRFIRRRGSVNTAGTSATKTIERNEMIELIGRLHDTTTHIDLGLPGIPTQYTIPSQEHAAYAEYAGSKFVFLGYLLEFFKRRQETIVIMARSGATQDLLEEYLYMKNIQVRRHERGHQDQSSAGSQAGAQVELLSTKPNQVVDIRTTPSLIIAFDASFETLDPQVKSLRSRSASVIPIVHLLVSNSSEHIERCLPSSMPSPIRLRLLVRATYQACMNLGGSPTIITNPSDDLDGRPMDLGDISRAVRKSPNRRLQNVAAVVANATLSDDFAANWTINGMPELALEELDISPSTGSTISATPARSRNRSHTPISRTTGQVRNRSQTPVSQATTPTSRKRQLDIDTTGLGNKRQRMTPVREFADARENDAVFDREQELHRLIDSLRVELANEKRLRVAAEEAQQAAERKAADWHSSLAALQRRYEKRTQKSKEEKKANKFLTMAVENGKLRVIKLNTDVTNLRQQIAQQKRDLESARSDLKAVGGDIGALETAREEARIATTKAASMERSLESTRRDFDFLRNQYQDASSRAAELGSQVAGLESKVTMLTAKASDTKIRLKDVNVVEATKQHLAKIAQLEAEKRSIQVMYKKLEEESKLLKRNRGVQTRGSSTAPASPGQRSRQGSPAPGGLAPPSGSRASVLRHER